MYIGVSPYLSGTVLITNSSLLNLRRLKDFIIGETNEAKTNIDPDADEDESPEIFFVINEAKSFLRVENIVPPARQWHSSNDS